MTTSSAETSESYIADLARKQDYDRFAVAMFAPVERRASLFALIAFNGEIARVREVISQSLIGQMRLQFWRDAIEGLYAGRSHVNPIAAGLGKAIKNHNLSRAPFDALIDAREADLDDAPLPSMAALERYALGTAGTLARLWLEVLGVRGEVVEQAADHTGIAWALTGLLRAAGFHAANARAVLPSTVPAESIVEQAHAHIRQARALRRQLPRDAVPGLLLVRSAEVYLDRLRRAHFDLMEASWSEVRPPVGRLALAAWLGRY